MQRNTTNELCITLWKWKWKSQEKNCETWLCCQRWQVQGSITGLNRGFFYQKLEERRESSLLYKWSMDGWV